MALDLSKLNFFSKLNARTRVFVLLGAVIGVSALVYMGTRYLSGPAATTGASRVAEAPKGLQSVPGGQLTPEYYRALQQANTQAAQQAQISGGSAIPTLVNIGGQGAPQPTANCNIICSDQSVNVKSDLDDWVKQGKVSPEIANGLQQLADKNISTEDYAAELDRLVKDGKLTPEQARELLEKYKKQHANKLLQDSAVLMDQMIKSGQLPLDSANKLLAAQKANVTSTDYAGMAQQLAKEGKISSAAAQQLLAQYAQQRAREVVMRSIASLHQLARTGQITADIEKELIELETKMVAVDLYSATLQKYVTDGKIIPAVAGKILDEFKSQKAEISPAGSVNDMLQAAEAAAYGELDELLKAGKISQEVASQLRGLIQKNISFDDFKAAIALLVKQNQLTAEIAKLKIADYLAVKGLREMSAKLSALQGNNASADEYASALKNAVQLGWLTPEQAAQLMNEYQSHLQSLSGIALAPNANISGTQAFAALQQGAQQGAATVTPAATSEEFTAAEAESAKQFDEERAARVEALAGAMGNQAQQLLTAWQPPTMVHKAGIEATEASKLAAAAGAGSTTGGAPGTTGEATLGGAPLIKAGTVVFAVLDTAANSDYPDSPVMATVVEGKYKGAKLLGKLTTTKGVSGQMDRVSLNFTMMNLEDWPKSKTITAYGIDPDTARTVLASSVDYHYMKRFGAMMATSFLQGYGQAVMASGGSSTQSAFGTSTTNPALSPSSKVAAAFGQMATAVGQATQNYVNTPPTVNVDSGVGLGILFMSDVT